MNAKKYFNIGINNKEFKSIFLWAITDNKINNSHHNNIIIAAMLQHKKQWQPTTIGTWLSEAWFPAASLDSYDLVVQQRSSPWLGSLTAW